MKKIIFTLLFAAALQIGYSQITYYWVGGPAPSTTSFNSSGNWNTTLGGGGSPRTTPLQTDILIFDGSDVDDDAGIQPGPIVFGFSAPPAGTGPSQLKFQGGVDVTLKRSGTGSTTTLNVGVGNTLDNDPDFVVAAASTLRIANPAASLVIALDANATGEVYGDIVMVENTNDGTTSSQNRITAKGARSLHFMAGSTFNTLPAYNYYPFGSGGSILPGAYGVVFESGSVYNYGGGWSPFGGSSTTFAVEFKPGSKFYFHAPPISSFGGTSTNMFTNRKYADVIVDNNTTVTADGSLTGIDSLRIEAGSTFITNVSGSTPINSHILNNGTLRVPAADPDRNNRLIMVGSTLQNISGTGTYTLADFIISNQSNVKLNRSVQVDTITNILGILNTSTNGISGPGTIVVKSPATTTVTGRTVVDSFVVTNISDLTTGAEIGMSITGPGIPVNTVITNLSTTAGTITLSKATTAAGTSQPFVIFNGQGAVLPIKFGNVSATLQNNQVKVSWQMLTEDNINRYSVERSANAREFSEIGLVKATNSTSYNFTDVAPFGGAGFYRIKAVSNDGEIKYSSVLRVTNAKGKAEFSVYPNPVKDGSLNVQLGNLTKGSYMLNLSNNLGQSIFSKTISFDGGSLNQNIALPASVRAGVYRLTLKGDNNTLNQTIVVQ